MGQSLVNIYTHIIFSTKNREPLINSAIEGELHRYLVGIVTNLNCKAIKVGGHVDHIHALCMLSKQLPITKLVQELKMDSSRWVKGKGEQYNNLYWQDGYGAFSVGSNVVDTIASYIENQHIHHRKITFQEEYRAFLIENRVEYNESYVWT
ncbi:MAG: IS200/IS605 family transposase [Chitinophagaceae bacterium]|nr:IS200/IS605 family transposase [Chitinophagaceae bacterium]